MSAFPAMNPLPRHHWCLSRRRVLVDGQSPGWGDASVAGELGASTSWCEPGGLEPFFVRFDASVKFRICMTPEDLARSGLEEIGRKLAS